MEIQGLLDLRNSDLWEKISKIHEVVVQTYNGREYLSYSKGNATTIYVPIDNIDSASFTHELLHIFLRTQNIFIGSGLILFVKESAILSDIFPDDLLEHIGNCIDHIRMLPKFLELGYSERSFIMDYDENKLTETEITFLKNNFVSSETTGKVYNPAAFTFYIAKYFSVIACPNSSINYIDGLKELKKIDAELFDILEAFKVSWNEYDPHNENPIKSSYYSFLFDFIAYMEKWVSRRIVK